MASLGRASALLGAGTLVSRLTGLLRSVVLVAAVGTLSAGDAFFLANQLPNNIYAIISTGILTGVIVPQIVKAATHRDGGSAFVSKLMTLGVVILLAATALATLAAPVIVQLYGARFDPATLALATAFAYWCLPQLLFYGIYALVGEVLNARRVFGPYTWAPIINNVVSIAGFLVFIALFAPSDDPIGWTPDMIAVLGGTATFGIVAQALVLLFFWRRAGLTIRPDFVWRGMGLRHIGRLAGWTFLMVVVGQLAGLAQSAIVSAATGAGASIAVMQLAWLVFMLPYSVIAFSIGTPYFTQLSEHAVAGRMDEVRQDLDASIRAVNVFMVAALAAVAAAIVPISRIFTQSAETSISFAWVLGAYLIGLIPLSILFVIQRTFYAFHDTRSPFLFTLVQCVIAVATAGIAAVTLDLTFLAFGIALGQSLASLVQLMIALRLLRTRHLGSLGLGRALRALVRFLVAGAPAAAAGWIAFLLFGGVDGWTTTNQLTGALGTFAIGAVVGVVYLVFLALLRAPELAIATRAARRFLPGR